MNVVIIGAGGHGRVVLDILRHDVNISSIMFVDDNDRLASKIIDGAPVIGKINSLGNLVQTYDLGGAIIAVGDNQTRARLYHKLEMIGLKMINAIHPHALIARDVTIGEGVVIASGAIISTGCKIGNDVIINTGVILENDNCIGDHVHISPGVNIAGNVTVNNYTHVGIGVSIIDNIKLGENVVIGAGAAVMKTIPDNSLAVGIPAKVIRNLASGFPTKNHEPGKSDTKRGEG